MSVFMELMQSVDMGLRCKVNLETKSLHIDRKPVIENGVLLGERRELLESSDLDEFEDLLVGTFSFPWATIDYLYDRYKYSMPTKNSMVVLHKLRLMVSVMLSSQYVTKNKSDKSKIWW